MTAEVAAGDAARVLGRHRLAGLVVVDERGAAGAGAGGGGVAALGRSGSVRDDPGLARVMDEQGAGWLCTEALAGKVADLLREGSGPRRWRWSTTTRPFRGDDIRC